MKNLMAIALLWTFAVTSTVLALPFTCSQNFNSMGTGTVAPAGWSV